MITRWYVLTFLITKAFAENHTIQLWEHEEFSGNSMIVINTKPRGVESCHTIAKNWWNRVSSLNTRLNCYQIFDSPQCTGDMRYIYPGSPSHNKLIDLDFDDKIKSFRLCDLNEEAVESAHSKKRSLSPRRPEKGFWEYLFQKYSPFYLETFLARARQSWFISWDFIPNVYGSKGRQYQYAIEWVKKIIKSGAFEKEDLEELRRRAQAVVDDRIAKNEQYGSTGSRSDAIHKQLVVIWRQLVETIDQAINKINNDLVDSTNKLLQNL